MIVKEETRKKRQKKTAEVFTPDTLVNEMLDKLPEEVWSSNKSFCDPAAGNGNFLVHILIRKIEHNYKPIDALKSIYGVDIKEDNVNECRARLLKIVSLFEKITDEHIEVVVKNIVHCNSLNYSFNFKFRKNKKETFKKLLKLGWEKDVKIPLF